MHVLITGGTGFVGGWTAKTVADAGHSIRFLVRNPERLQTSVAKLGVDVSDFAVGDITVSELAHMLGQVSGTPMVSVPIPDTALRVAGAVLDRAGRFLPFDTPVTWAGMQYYTQMPASDDSPSERELGITYRDPRETLADTFAALRAAS